MATKLEPNQLVGFTELLMSEVIQSAEGHRQQEGAVGGDEKGSGNDDKIKDLMFFID